MPRARECTLSPRRTPQAPLPTAPTPRGKLNLNKLSASMFIYTASTRTFLALPCLALHLHLPVTPYLLEYIYVSTTLRNIFINKLYIIYICVFANSGFLRTTSSAASALLTRRDMASCQPNDPHTPTKSDKYSHWSTQLQL